MIRFLFLLVFLLGTSCEEEQFSPAEINFDLQPLYAWTRISNDKPYAFDIQIFNSGDEQLVLELPIEVVGDSRCSFSFSGPTKTKLGRNESAFVRGFYQPEKTGEDHILLRFKSNSETFPVFDFYVCGLGIKGDDPEPTQNLECKKPEPNQSDCSEEQWLEE